MQPTGDFTADRRLLSLAAIAAVIGSLCAVVAFALLELIQFFTNVFYFQRASFAAVEPGAHALGPWAILVPAAGGLLIGLMARYGSDRIRGHGIPEAIEAILIGRSRMEPKVAVLKPLSSAISIGSGGPFGAEGPIIMTGGACGSIIAQALHLTAAERKTLLVSGAAAGMSATFAAPLASVLLAVELLLFEWKPRSIVPVAVASAVAAALRPYVLGAGPLFPAPVHAELGPFGLVAALGVGIVAGMISALLTKGVYAAEEAFEKLPMHWMWWPTLGGLAVGLGGVVEPRALGVGYDVIRDLLGGNYAVTSLAALLVVKAVIWTISLGSGTSGGVLAPLLIVGGSLGALESTVLPEGSAALWPLVSMGAMLGGTMRSPLTGIVFAMELTHDVNALPPLLIASFAAHALTVLVMPRSILTEKVARRGVHLSREYSVDPLEAVPLREVMTTNVVTIDSAKPAGELIAEFFDARRANQHKGYPVVDEQGRIVGVVTRATVLELLQTNTDDRAKVGELVHQAAIIAHPDESCRVAAERMATNGIGRLPVVARGELRVIGIVTLNDLLKARGHALDLEHRRERVLRLRRDSATVGSA